APVPSSGAPTPGETPPAAPPANGQPPAEQPSGPPPVTTAPIGPLVGGDGITYQLVQQDEGYFEGRMVITNRTGRPMTTWTLTFRAPGADVKNIWGAALVHGGTEVEIRNLDGARAIPPGGTWEIQYGAAGRASTPKGCELNGEACGF
ncbi:cellulose binding domain-containing protein, partial [Actinomadura geliboluensis]